jgi:hypothetical protein
VACVLPQVLCSLVIIPVSLPGIPESVSCVSGRLPVIALSVPAQLSRKRPAPLGLLHMPGSSILPGVEHFVPGLPKVLSRVAPQEPGLAAILLRVTHDQVGLPHILSGVLTSGAIMAHTIGRCDAGAMGLEMSLLLSQRRGSDTRHQQGHEGRGVCAKHELPPSKTLLVDADCRRQLGEEATFTPIAKRRWISMRVAGEDPLRRLMPSRVGAVTLARREVVQDTSSLDR